MFSRFVSNLLSHHDNNFVCDLFSPYRLQPSRFIGKKGNSERRLLNYILDYCLDRNPAILKYTKSQRLQEIFFFTLLNGLVESYLEAGANDGLLYSNTYALYNLTSSLGICVEASPRLYDSLILNRPNNINFNYALSDVSGQALTLHDNTSHGLFAHIQEPSELVVKHSCLQESVQSMTLEDVLNECSESCISFLSLDIEGSELKTLKALAKPLFLAACIEANKHSSKLAISSILSGMGYTCYHYPFASNEVVAVLGTDSLNAGLVRLLEDFKI